jgi:hypothetical protein
VAIDDNMGDQAYWPGKVMSSHDVWPELPSTDSLSFYAFLDKVWALVEQYGQVCSVIVGTGIVFRMLTWCWGVFLRLTSTPQTANLALHVVAAFFPALGDRMMRGAYWNGVFSAMCRGILFIAPDVAKVEPVGQEHEASAPKQNNLDPGNAQAE